MSMAQIYLPLRSLHVLTVLSKNRNPNNEVYSVAFIQHEAVQYSSSASLDMMGAERGPPEVWLWKANQGIRADPECIAVMRERGLKILKESQIKSWLGSYHQKRKREMERMAADLQSAGEIPSLGVANPPACPSTSGQTSNATSGTASCTAASPVTKSLPSPSPSTCNYICLTAPSTSTPVHVTSYTPLSVHHPLNLLMLDLSILPMAWLQLILDLA
ncbi:hypothetical protein ACROYT_G015121 [Oculina patagonica]